MEKDISKSIVAKTLEVQTWTGMDYYYKTTITLVSCENICKNPEEIVISTDQGRLDNPLLAAIKYPYAL